MYEGCVYVCMYVSLKGSVISWPNDTKHVRNIDDDPGRVLIYRCPKTEKDLLKYEQTTFKEWRIYTENIASLVKRRRYYDSRFMRCACAGCVCTFFITFPERLR